LVGYGADNRTEALGFGGIDAESKDKDCRDEQQEYFGGLHGESLLE
jgi:hypothetical protein